MTELVENPWLNISWENSIAEIDKEYLTKFSCFKKIQKNTLPEPYTGDVRSNVYCLNLNPGDACVCDQLIRQAMAENKYIVIMRHRKEWLQRISGLEEYERLAYLNSPENPCLTKNNFKPSPRVNFNYEELQKQF